MADALLNCITVRWQYQACHLRKMNCSTASNGAAITIFIIAPREWRITFMLQINEIKIRINFVIGMPRAGTTFLYYNLEKHPNIFLPYRKELKYFNTNYVNGEEWYINFYKEIANDEVTLI